MMGRSGYELVVGSAGAELMRIPLRRGAHPLFVGSVSGTLWVSDDGVLFCPRGASPCALSAAPSAFGSVELCIEALDDGEDDTLTHDLPGGDASHDALRVLALPQERELARMLHGELSVGGDPDCDVRLHSTRVSRLHCFLQRKDGVLLVRDADSKNGTFVNGIRVSECSVQLPAHVRCGDAELRIEAERDERALVVAPFIVGKSEPVAKLRESIAQFSPTEAPVLIVGESGSGKELVARAIFEGSRRATRPFVAVNCGALAPSLVESELFGHARGAFTGASERRAGAFVAANGGVLFLDEVGELPLHLQPLLLRVLEMREVRAVGDDRATPVDVRVITATHRDLRHAVSEGRFREDLFHRLNVLRIKVPALRDRGRDLEMLALHFARTLAPDRFIALSDEAMRKLRAHPFSGNVRELRNVIHRAICVSRGDLLLPEHLELEAPITDLAASAQGLSAVERAAYVRALKEARGSRAKAARTLGVARSTIYRKMEEHGIHDQEIFGR